MTIHMLVTNDRYELPIAVADTKADLSRMMGKTDSWTCALMRRQLAGKPRKPYMPIYVAVEVDDDEGVPGGAPEGAGQEG